MIRFILKDSASVFKTFDIQHPALECALFNKLNKHEVIGIEHVDKEHIINLLPTEVLPDGKMGIRVGYTSERRLAAGGVVGTKINTISDADRVGGSVRITPDAAIFTGSAGSVTITLGRDEDPKLPEKYTPVLVRDNTDGEWDVEAFLCLEENADYPFACNSNNWKQIALFAGNEEFINTCKMPPVCWIAENGKPKLMRS